MFSLIPLSISNRTPLLFQVMSGLGHFAAMTNKMCDLTWAWHPADQAELDSDLKIKKQLM
jgi:hypothetical protein